MMEIRLMEMAALIHVILKLTGHVVEPLQTAPQPVSLPALITVMTPISVRMTAVTLQQAAPIPTISCLATMVTLVLQMMFASKVHVQQDQLLTVTTVIFVQMIAVIQEQDVPIATTPCLVMMVIFVLQMMSVVQEYVWQDLLLTAMTATAAPQIVVIRQRVASTSVLLAAKMIHAAQTQSAPTFRDVVSSGCCLSPHLPSRVNENNA